MQQSITLLNVKPARVSHSLGRGTPCTLVKRLTHWLARRQARSERHLRRGSLWPERPMISRFHRSSRAAARAIAIFGALLILVSTSIGASHFHERAVSRNGLAVAQVAVDEGLCPVCQFALHSPGSLSSTTTVTRGPVIVDTIFLAAPVRSESPVFSAARVRAPPIAL